MFIPKQGLEIIRLIEAAGFECFAVGGCVRDALLSRACDDYDFTTSAEPDEVISALKPLKCGIIPTGIQHGTITVVYQRYKFEVTTYRVDGDYSDGRRPDGVTYTKSLAQDLKRRDFTINALAYNPNAANEDERLIDLFGGREDINNKIVRCVGEASERFSEDYLRMLRAYRFAAVLGFRLDSATRDAAVVLRGYIKEIAAERVMAEFRKLLISDNYRAIELFIDDYADVLLPEFYLTKGITQENNYHCYDVYSHSMAVLRYAVTKAGEDGAISALPLRLAAILHDIGKPTAKTMDSNGTAHFHGHEAIGVNMAEDILRRMRFDNTTIEAVSAIVFNHDNAHTPDAACVKRLLNRVGEEYAEYIIEFIICDTMGKSIEAIERKLPVILAVKAELRRVLADSEPYAVKHLAVNGGDIMRFAGISPGKAVGDALTRLLEAVIENPALNERDTLINIANHYPNFGGEAVEL